MQGLINSTLWGVGQCSTTLIVSKNLLTMLTIYVHKLCSTEKFPLRNRVGWGLLLDLSTFKRNEEKSSRRIFSNQNNYCLPIHFYVFIDEPLTNKLSKSDVNSLKLMTIGEKFLYLAFGYLKLGRNFKNLQGKGGVILLFDAFSTFGTRPNWYFTRLCNFFTFLSQGWYQIIREIRRANTSPQRYLSMT